MLYEGGRECQNNLGTDRIIIPRSNSNPHYEAIKREELPLSKLFHMYLVISGKNKTDPDIVHWITNFLTDAKKVYLVYLL